MNKHWVGVACMVSIIAAAPAASAQSPQKLTLGDGRPVPSGNVLKGQHVFDAICWACHSHDLSGGKAPPLTGSAFYKIWQGQRVDALFDLIHNTMPRDDPGFLSDDMAHDVVAYIVSYANSPKNVTGGKTRK